MQMSIESTNEFFDCNISKYNRNVKQKNKKEFRISISDTYGIGVVLKSILDYMNMSKRNKAKLINKDKLIRINYGKKVSFER
jgi:hypothetical protein